MKISITKSGTIVPLATVTELDSDSLAPHDVTKLRSLVKRAGIGSSRPGSSEPTQPDRGSFRIAVEDGVTASSISARDQDLKPGARALVNWVDRHPHATRRIEPQGS